MHYKKKRDNKKPLAVALGVILALAPGAVIIDNLEPVPVYADAGEFAGLQDYINNVFAVDSSGNPSALFDLQGFTAYLAALWTVNQCLQNPIYSEPVLVSSFNTVSGEFIHNGSRYTCITGFPSETSTSLSDGGFVCAESPLFNIHLSFAPNDGLSHTYSVSQTMANTSTYVIGSWSFQRTDSSGNLHLTFHGSGNGILEDAEISPSVGNTSFQIRYTFSSNLPVIPSGASVFDYLVRVRSNATYLPIAGNGIRPYLPDSDSSYASLDYISNVLNPYYINEYPDIEPYVYVPYSPEFPDPSDAYPGIPKDWTIKNPQLPTSPQIGFNAYNVDTSDFDVSATLTEYTDGFGFWWWLTGKCLDVTNTKGIVIAAIILGLVGFILWRLGGSL